MARKKKEVEVIETGSYWKFELTDAISIVEDGKKYQTIGSIWRAYETQTSVIYDFIFKITSYSDGTEDITQIIPISYEGRIIAADSVRTSISKDGKVFSELFTDKAYDTLAKIRAGDLSDYTKKRKASRVSEEKKDITPSESPSENDEKKINFLRCTPQYKELVIEELQERFKSKLSEQTHFIDKIVLVFENGSIGTIHPAKDNVKNAAYTIEYISE